LEVEFTARSLAGPESQVVCRLSGITGNGHVVGDGLDGLAAFPVTDGLARLIGGLVDVAVELNLTSVSAFCPCKFSGEYTHINGHIMSRELPRVEIKPVVGDLNLITINDFLLEDTIPVPQTITPSRIVQRCQTVEEAGSQTAQSAIAQRSVVLLLNNVLDAETEVGKTSLGEILLSNVEHSIVQGSSHQELQAEVVDTLAVSKGLTLLGAIPLKDQTITESQAGGGVSGSLVAVEHATSQRGLDMADNLALEAILVLEAGALVFQPGLALRFRDRR